MTINITKAGKIIARNVAQIRKESEITQAQMAEATGVSRRTIQRIEQANTYGVAYNPLLSTAVKIANAAQITVQDLIYSQLEIQ